MAFDVGDTVSEAWDRFATQAGAVVVLAAGAVGILQNIAVQDLLRALLLGLESLILESSDQMDPQEIEQFQRSIDQALATLPLSLGLSPGVALLLWLGAFVLTAAVIAVAIDAFGSSRDRLTGVEVEGLGRKTAHLALGQLVVLIAIVVGFVVFVIPGFIVALVAAFLLPYFPVAVVLDDESFASAYGSSVDYARDNLGDTVILVLVAIAVFIGVGFVGGVVVAVLPATVGAVVEQFFSAIATIFVLAMLTRAYQATDSTDPETVGADDGEVHEEWGSGDGA